MASLGDLLLRVLSGGRFEDVVTGQAAPAAVWEAAERERDAELAKEALQAAIAEAQAEERRKHPEQYPLKLSEGTVLSSLEAGGQGAEHRGSQLHPRRDRSPERGDGRGGDETRLAEGPTGRHFYAA